MKRYLPGLLLVMFACLQASAQDFSKGLLPFESYDSQDFDSINLANMNLIVHIPIISYPQLGQLHGLSLSATYNNPTWQIITAWTGYCYCGFYVPSTTDLGLTVFRDDEHSVGAYPDPSTGYTYVYFAADASGGAHMLGWTGTNTVKSYDASGLSFNDSSYILTDRDGIQYDLNGFFPGFYPETDTRGNSITPNYYFSGGYVYYTDWTDSVGRTIPAPTSMQYQPSSAGCQTLSYPSPGGGSASDRPPNS